MLTFLWHVYIVGSPEDEQSYPGEITGEGAVRPHQGESLRERRQQGQVSHHAGSGVFGLSSCDVLKQGLFLSASLQVMPDLRGGQELHEGYLP